MHGTMTTAMTPSKPKSASFVHPFCELSLFLVDTIVVESTRVLLVTIRKGATLVLVIVQRNYCLRSDSADWVIYN